MTEIAVFTTSIDEPTFGPVVRILESKGFSTFVYNGDKVASQEHDFSYTIDDNSSLTFCYNDRTINLAQLGSAWYRHPYIYNLPTEDMARKMTLEREMDAQQDSMIRLIPEEQWLNDPSKMNTAQDKIGQLLLAKTLGFSIPSTIVSNQWKSIDEFFNEDEYVIKMPKGLTYVKNRARVLYTTKINHARRMDLAEDNPYPGIFQKFMEKHREWRVTVVEDDVFEVAIYTNDEAKDDWRKHQFSDRVQFRRETMPDEHKARCVKFLSSLGLKYGTFDFIENDDSKMTFLECNVNGQYRWLEDILDLPISEAIAGSLIKIAKA